MRKAWLIVLPLLLVACVDNKRTYLPNGMAVNQLTCKMSVNSLQRCYRTAGDMCGPRGYSIYDWDGTPWPKPYPDPSTMDDPTVLNEVTILVACHPEMPLTNPSGAQSLR
ncbi:MAG: hypothetical protein AB7O80_02245 [Acetobacteraceae bacterium]